MHNDGYVIAMPAYNEASGIVEFLQELRDHLGDRARHFIVVDDCSTDSTPQELARLADEGFPLTWVRPPANAGHGPSTIRALSAALELPHPVIAVDGDGQFRGEDVARLCAAHADGGWDVVEGARQHRADPLFRRVVSRATAVLVHRACGVTPTDANTPLRAYTHDALKRLLHELPPGAMTPNLMISALCRSGTYGLHEVPVRSLPRRGDPAVGTWGDPRAWFPSRSFVRFCRRATGEWMAFARLP